MATTWTTEIEDLTGAEPQWSDELVPWCSEHQCPSHDGKRCALLGLTRDCGDICEVAVDKMADLLSRRTP